MVSAKHLCVSSRGIKDKSSYTTTLEYGGSFNDKEIRNEFFECIGQKKYKINLRLFKRFPKLN